MGLLIDGTWHDQWYDTDKHGGRFERWESAFRNWVTSDGAPGPTGEGGFKAEPGRYHLYVSYACPWAHRTLIYRSLKGLEDAIGVSVVHWLMRENGWTFKPDDDGIVGDDLFGSKYLYEIYLKAAPGYSGRVTVPVLWDKARGRIVSHESAEIIRMFNSAFDGVTGNAEDYYPAVLRPEIDELNAPISSHGTTRVYKAGFATSPAPHQPRLVGMPHNWQDPKHRKAPHTFTESSPHASLAASNTICFHWAHPKHRKAPRIPEGGRAGSFPGTQDEVDMEEQNGRATGYISKC